MDGAKIVPKIHSLHSTDEMPPRRSTTCSLTPIDWNNPHHRAELLRQRKICGWANIPAVLEEWASKSGKQFTLFWIGVPNSRETQLQKTGHIAMGSYPMPFHPELGSRDGTALHMSCLFVLPEFRGRGLATAALSQLESLAIKEPYGSPRCHTMTLETMDRRYYEDHSYHWGAMLVRMGYPMPPKGRSNEDSFAKAGYVTWKHVPRPELVSPDGKEKVRMLTSFMRKRLQNLQT